MFRAALLFPRQRTLVTDLSQIFNLATTFFIPGTKQSSSVVQKSTQAAVPIVVQA